MAEILTKEDIIEIRSIRIHRILNVPDNGRRVSIACPIHKGRNPNFNLYPDNSFHCFKCEANGSGAIDFCQALGFSFKEAVQELAEYL